MDQSTKRKWQHSHRVRIAAILLGFLPLLLTEGLLTVLELPQQPAAIDPYVDLHHLRPLFARDPGSGKLVIGPERLHLFRPTSFAQVKPAGTFRVFALGGSTTQGEPYSTETAFPAWLRLNLQARCAGREFEVINCGGLSYASYRVLAILREVLEYKPDLIVIYTGHNEFLERRTYENWMPTSTKANALAWLTQFRTVQAARTLIAMPAARAIAPTRTQLAAEVDALLDYSGGLEDYYRGDTWREPVVDHFRWNVEQMILACQQREVPLILVRPVSNLVDCPPFKCEVDTKLSDDQQADFLKRWESLCMNRHSSRDQLAEVDHLLAIDPEHAGLLYVKGRDLSDGGEWESAKRFFVAARDADVCPLRAITPIEQAVTELSERFGVPLLDAEQLISDSSENQLPSSQWLIDHVHPTVEGHQLIGEALAELCVKERLVTERLGDWKAVRADLYSAHLRELGEPYFHRGKQRLEGLMMWTQGRAKKMKPNHP